MNKIESAKESLKQQLQELLKTELVVLNNPETMYNEVVYCVLKEIEIIHDEMYHRFKIVGTIKLIKSNDNNNLGVLTELILSGKNDAKNNMSFFAEKLTDQTYCMDFVFISDKYYHKAIVVKKLTKKSYIVNKINNK